jgi:hypothetical protein
MRMPKTPIKTLDQRHNGIHGPGCECTPESALHVQYTTYVFCTTFATGIATTIMAGVYS